MTDLNIAFSGSGFLCPAEVGALLAVESQGYRIASLAGTSGGAIVAAFYATHEDAPFLENLVLNEDWVRLMDFGKPWQYPAHILRFMRQKGWCNPAPLEAFLHEHIGYCRFSELDVDLRITASCLETDELQIFSRTTTPNVLIADAVRASTSLPVIYPPKLIHGKHYEDGGLTRNLPGNLLPNDTNKSYCVYLTGNHHMTPYSNSVYRLASSNINMLLDAQEKLDIMSAQWVDFVEVNTGKLDALDGSMTGKQKRFLINNGKSAMLNALQGLIDRP